MTVIETDPESIANLDRAQNPPDVGSTDAIDIAAEGNHARDPGPKSDRAMQRYLLALHFAIVTLQPCNFDCCGRGELDRLRVGFNKPSFD